MALVRRSSRVTESHIWPGFVDALATLLMVIIFLLMIFFLIQINLAQRVSGQDDDLKRLRGDLASLSNLLNIEREENESLRLSNQDLSIALEAARSDRDEALSEIERQQLTVANLEERLEEITRSNEANLEKVEASAQEILELTSAINAINDRLGQLQALVDEKEEEARLAKLATANLTKQLNNALAGRVLELQSFKSEFFGRMREALKDRTDITIVGDRFVFQSEVLFDVGSADLDLDGEAQLRELSIALLEISNTIPSEIDWILQVSGHTDDTPISTTRFRDNWDLSTERALSVVRYFVLSGIDQKRLSASGFGEYHPIDRSNTPEARARNRRIEIKLTER
jgi:chemotaxis protein MotB